MRGLGVFELLELFRLIGVFGLFESFVLFELFRVVGLCLFVLCLFESFELFGWSVFTLCFGSGCVSCFCVRVGLVFRLCVLKLCY